MFKKFLAWAIMWFQLFWDKHGDRVAFSFIASMFGIGFIIIGLKAPTLKEFVGAGTTILIGVAMLFFNKARSPEQERLKEEITDEKDE